MKHAFFLPLFFLPSLAFGQSQVITKLHNGVSTFYYDGTTLDFVVAAALDGDTIVLPGGPILTGGINLNKTITFIGGGILANGTPVTGKTIIPYAFNQDIVLQAGSEGSSFHGIDFQRVVRFTGNVSDVSFVRCAFETFSLAGFNQTAASDVHAKHCIFRAGIGNGGSTAPQGLLIENSIVVGSINFTGGVASALVTQCVFLGYSGGGTQYGVTYSGNLFLCTTSSISLNNFASYQCNLFGLTGGNTVTWTNATNLGNNIGWQIAGNNIIDLSTINDFNEADDFHLTPNGPGFSSTQMTCAQSQVGIYGGVSPWKEGAIPFNPHWLSLSPALGGTNGGVINVNFSGAAQQD